MSIVGLASRKESLQGVVSWNDEAGQVGQELTAEVEDDEEEVQSGHANNGVDFGNRGLLLEVVELWVFGKLPSISN